MLCWTGKGELSRLVIKIRQAGTVPEPVCQEQDGRVWKWISGWELNPVDADSLKCG